MAIYNIQTHFSKLDQEKATKAIENELSPSEQHVQHDVDNLPDKTNDNLDSAALSMNSNAWNIMNITSFVPRIPVWAEISFPSVRWIGRSAPQNVRGSLPAILPLLLPILLWYVRNYWDIGEYRRNGQELCCVVSSCLDSIEYARPQYSERVWNDYLSVTMPDNRFVGKIRTL